MPRRLQVSEDHQDLSTSPRALVEAVRFEELRASVRQARVMYPSGALVLIVTDARSLAGVALWAALSQLPKGEAAARALMATVAREVEVAKREVALGGRLQVHFTCGPAATFCAVVGEWGEPYTSMLGDLHGDVVRAAVFSERGWRVLQSARPLE